MASAVHSWLVLGGGRGPAAQHDVPSIGERPLWHGRLGIELRHEALAAGLIRERLQDRIAGHQRGAGEVHLGDQAASELATEEREVDVRRTPGVAMVLPWIRAGLDRDEAVPAVVVRQAATRPAEVGIERRRV